MILQSLVTLYDRRAKLGADENSGPAPVGFEWKAIPFVIVVDPSGGFVSLQDTRRVDGKKLIASSEMVPAGIKKTSGIAANLLWDTAEYMLGVETEIKNKVAKPERIREQHIAFRARLDELPESVQTDEGIAAVLAFLGKVEERDKLRASSDWETLRTANPLMSFRLQHDSELVCQREAFRTWWLAQMGNEDADGTCLITGNKTVIARLHPPITNVTDPGSAIHRKDIVSFNQDSFRSYGKDQGANAPIGKTAAAKYSTALNDLLKDGRHRTQVGDATTVFWSEEVEHPIESAFAALFSVKTRDDPTHDIEHVKRVYASIHSGKHDEHGRDSRFHVLGLAPNAARLSVRFWHVDTVAGISEKIGAHFDDLEIAHATHEQDFLSLFRLLVACAAQGKADNIPPNLGGDVMRAVLQGTAYPQTWLQATIRRNRAEQSVNYPRAAVIKACLNRLIRSRSTGEKELTVSLDETDNNTAYRLGRLFSTLEKIQEEANPGLNTTIRERYYGAASSSPATVFTTLMRLKNHHLAKLEHRGRAMNFERLIGEIISGIKGFPAQLAITDQGRFAIGYYHQRQAFYTRTVKSIESEGEPK